MAKKITENLPHTDSVQRVQESWEEFKRKANPPFEYAVDNITHGIPAGTGRVTAMLKKAGPAVRRYRNWILAGAAIGAVAVILSAIKARRDR